MSTRSYLPANPSKCRILWEGYRWRIDEVRADRFFLVDSDGSGTQRELMLRDIKTLVDSGTLFFENDFFDDHGSIIPVAPANAVASGMTDDELYYCHLMTGYMVQLDAAYNNGSVKLYPKSLEANFMGPVVDQAASNYAMLAMGWIDPEQKKRRKGKSVVPTYNPPGASDLKRMYQKYRLPGFKFTDLKKNYDRCDQGGKRLDSYVKAVAENVMLEFHADERRMKIGPLRRHIGAVLNKDQPAGQWTIKPPSHGAIKRIKEDLERHRIIGAQKGSKEMEDETGSWTSGPVYTQVGEMVYLDCYKTDIVVQLMRAGVWMTLSRTIRRLLKSLRRRVWVCVCIDAATRVVLGISFGLAESPELAVRTLRMSLSDKGHYAVLAKCGAPPPRAIGISGISTDSGSAFRSKRFRTVANNVSGNVQIGVVGIARHRGIIERLFRTMHDQFISYFTGQTFSNIMERGDYNSADRLSMFLEDFANLMFRWICDCYHLQGHAGLKGQPPLNRFNETIAETGYSPAMSEDKLRVEFGLDLERKLTPLGFRFAGIQYTANWLGERFKRRAGETMRIKVDPVNLGRISVLVDGQWATLPGPPEMQGVSLSFWLARCDALARKHGEQAQVNFETVGKALLSIASLSSEARCKADLEDRSYTSETLEDAEKKVKLRFVYRPRPAAHGGSLQITQSAQNGYRTGVSLSLRQKTASFVNVSDELDEVLDLEDEDFVSEPTLDDTMKADNDNTAEDPLPEVDEVDVAAIPKSKATAEPVLRTRKPKKSGVDVSVIVSGPRNKIKKAAGEN